MIKNSITRCKMTADEKLKKIKTAQDDLKTLRELLDNFDLHKASTTVNKLFFNPDYAKSIIQNRIKHNIPAGNKNFDSLTFVDKINVIKMFIDVVSDSLKELILTPTDSDSQ